jgi:Carboxypeptidase regulatory-like domain
VRIVLLAVAVAFGVASAGCTSTQCAGGEDAGLSVEVTDMTNNAPIVTATVTATDGSYSETLMTLDTGDYVGAFDRPGTYMIAVSAPGYIASSFGPITVTGDACQVTTQTVAAPLAVQP